MLFEVVQQQTIRYVWYVEADNETDAEESASDGTPDIAMGRTLEDNIEASVPPAHMIVPN
jgi:hypothetical protein